MGNQSVLCPVCQRVLPASGRDAYTPLRGRLIVTNGYCGGGCAERRAEAVEQTQQVARPMLPAAPPMPGQPMPGQVNGQLPGQMPGQVPAQNQLQGQVQGQGQLPVPAVGQSMMPRRRPGAGVAPLRAAR
ncbi:hypothetical protein HII36_54335 [Nonomuraea sp. NN258]|uniref:hypothetical protein n=1 Tax=Nonomuraea antri TaxID=2730852 RepID=UPI00156A3483|nr:hypothetical protein [Nonomuraea antri]NRQ40731.1 hypothetical protein [Nonomuraea antri]